MPTHLAQLVAVESEAERGATATSTRRQAARALARAAPSFMSSSSPSRSMAAICLRRAHSHLSFQPSDWALFNRLYWRSMLSWFERTCASVDWRTYMPACLDRCRSAIFEIMVIGPLGSNGRAPAARQDAIMSARRLSWSGRAWLDAPSSGRFRHGRKPRPISWNQRPAPGRRSSATSCPCRSCRPTHRRWRCSWCRWRIGRCRPAGTTVGHLMTAPARRSWRRAAPSRAAFHLQFLPTQRRDPR